LIPKGSAGFVPIRILKERPSLRAVLIDDDMLVATTWRLSAERAGVDFKSFPSFAEFERL
jgi:hypothetical protein